MDDNYLSTEDLDHISELQAKKDAESHYTERPRFHRILAWICFGIVAVGIVLYCYWQITPLA